MQDFRSAGMYASLAQKVGDEGERRCICAPIGVCEQGRKDIMVASVPACMWVGMVYGVLWKDIQGGGGGGGGF